MEENDAMYRTIDDTRVLFFFRPKDRKIWKIFRYAPIDPSLSALRNLRSEHLRGVNTKSRVPKT